MLKENLSMKSINIGVNKKSPEGTFNVVMDGIEPPTQGFSVLCSTD